MLYVICDEADACRDYVDWVRRSPTPAAQRVVGLPSPEELPRQREQPVTVLGLPSPRDSPRSFLATIRDRCPAARPILLLPEDEPGLAPGLFRQGAFDLGYRLSHSRERLLQVVGHAANGADRPPYCAICKDTPEFNPLPDQPWALSICEPLQSRTDYRHHRALELLPRCLGLAEDALVFFEGNPALLPDLLELPNLVLALVSADSASNCRHEFLANIRQLEADGRRVITLCRRGIDLRGSPPDLQPAANRLVRYHSAIELLIRLVLGFGGTFS